MLEDVIGEQTLDGVGCVREWRLGVGLKGCYLVRCYSLCNSTSLARTYNAQLYSYCNTEQATYRAAVCAMASVSSASLPFCAALRFTSWIRASTFTLTSGLGGAAVGFVASASSVGVGELDAGGSDVEAALDRLPSATTWSFDVDGPATEDTGVDGVAGAGLSGKVDIPVACFTRPSFRRRPVTVRV